MLAASRVAAGIRPLLMWILARSEAPAASVCCAAVGDQRELMLQIGIQTQRQDDAVSSGTRRFRFTSRRPQLASLQSALQTTNYPACSTHTHADGGGILHP